MRQPTPRDVIEAKGHILAFYIFDLLYIDNFYRAKTGRLSQKDFLDADKKLNNSFRQFVWEFRVVRNIRAGQLENLLQETIEWTKSEDADNVDLFKQRIRAKEISHEKDMTSLCSKILFLNNPGHIHPYDDLAKRTLNYRDRSYVEYLQKVNEYKQAFETTINTLKDDLKLELDYLDTEFNKMKNSEVNSISVRDNRIVDKLLWTVGKNNR